MVRAATPLDAGATGAILSDWIDETPWMPRLHTRAEDIGFCGRMIEQGWVRVAGRAGIEGFVAREGEYVHALYVAGAARRAGIGSALIRSAMAETQRLSLWTFQANEPAQAFYTRLGFVAVEHTDGAANDEGLPDIRYVWEMS